MRTRDAACIGLIILVGSVWLKSKPSIVPAAELQTKRAGTYLVEGKISNLEISRDQACFYLIDKLGDTTPKVCTKEALNLEVGWASYVINKSGQYYEVTKQEVKNQPAVKKLVLTGSSRRSQGRIWVEVLDGNQVSWVEPAGITEIKPGLEVFMNSKGTVEIYTPR